MVLQPLGVALAVRPDDANVADEGVEVHGSRAYCLIVYDANGYPHASAQSDAAFNVGSYLNSRISRNSFNFFSSSIDSLRSL